MASLARLLAVFVAALGLSGTTASSRVPGGVSSIRIASSTGVTARVTHRAAVRQIVRWFDALPHFVARPCPYSVHKPPDVTFSFRAAGGVVLRAVDHLPGTCAGSITYSNDGQVKYAPLADDDFVARVSRLVGVHFGSPSETAGNRRAARRAVGKLLRLVVLPAGAHRVARAPGDAGGELARPWLPSSYTNYFHRHAFWHVDGSVDSVAAFIEAHRPRGSHDDGGQLSPSPRTLAFDLPPTLWLRQRELSIVIASRRDGSTAIRVDAFAVWNVVRSPREVVPAGVREIDFGSYRTRNARQIATIARWFNALPIAQPRRGMFGCILIIGPYIRIAFRGAARVVLARAGVYYNRGYSNVCNPIEFSIGGHRQQALIGGDFMRRVSRLLHARLG